MSTVRPANSRVQHGEAACANYGCKRIECLDARRARQKLNKYLKDAGRPGCVPSGRALQHIRRFRDAGVLDKEAIILLGIARQSFYRICAGKPISRGMEQRILRTPVPAALGEHNNQSVVDVTGTHRRLRALMAMGWPAGELERRLEVHAGWMTRSLGHRRTVRLALAVRVGRLYDGLWNKRPERHGVALADAEEARREAAQWGWPGPLAWDDDTIDDPRAVPMVDAPASSLADAGENAVARFLMGESILLDRDERGEVIAHLMEWTDLTVEQIAVRLESTPTAVDRKWYRIKKKARDEGRPVPWRRVFEQSYRGPEHTNQQEMEIAA